MNIDGLRKILCGASDDVELAVGAHAKPDVTAILEWFRYFFQPHNSFVEVDALRHVADVNRVVVKLRRRGGGGLSMNHDIEHRK